MLKRSKISLMAFISVSLVIIILISLYPDFFVHAQDSSATNFIDMWDMSEDTFLRSDFDYSSGGISNNQSYNNLYNTVYSNGFPIGDLWVSDFQYLSSNYDLTNYFCAYDSIDGGIYVGGCSADSIIVCNPNEFRVYTPTYIEPFGSPAYNKRIGSYNSGGNFVGYYQLGNYSNDTYIDGNYYLYESGDSLISSNLPIYYTSKLDFSISSFDELIDMNNPIADSGSSDVFPDGSGGSPANNLYLDSPDFHFNNKKYTPPYSDVINSGDTVPNGTISFNCNLNDYQIANASNFNLEFSYKLNYDVDYKNHYPTDFGPFKKTSQLLNNKKNLKIPFVSGVMSVPLTDFINSDNTYSVSFADVFSQLNYDTYNLSGLLTQSREVSSIEYNKFDLYCNVRLVSQGAKSNLYCEWYNPISKKGYLVSDAIIDNNNPYVVNPDQQADSDPDSTNISPDVSVPGAAGSGDSSSSSSNNNVVVNNYNTNNNNNNNNIQNDNSTPWLINKLFGDGTVQNGSIGDNRIEDLTHTTGANNWIEVMKQSFSFVPVGFFNQLQLFFGICLGIFVVAFILRIILDLL